MAVVNLNPVSDQGVGWTPSAVTSHYLLLDEGMARPVTTDYVYTNSIGPIDSFGFTFTDNGEQIISINFRAYFAAALGGSPYLEFYITDGSLSYNFGLSVPSAGVYKEAAKSLDLNPFTSAQWDWFDLSSGLYKIGFQATAGNGFNNLTVATFALAITTAPKSITMVRESLVNIR